MDQARRYRLRPNSIALTRRQWLVIVIAVVVGLAGVVLAFTDVLLGVLLMAAGGVAVGLTVAMRGHLGPPSP